MILWVLNVVLRVLFAALWVLNTVLCTLNTALEATFVALCTLNAALRVLNAALYNCNTSLRVRKMMEVTPNTPPYRLCEIADKRRIRFLLRRKDDTWVREGLQVDFFDY